MKKKDLKIADLKVRSFVTTVKEENANTVKGGISFFACDTINGIANRPLVCQNTILPDESICNPACITNFVEICEV